MLRVQNKVQSIRNEKRIVVLMYSSMSVSLLLPVCMWLVASGKWHVASDTLHAQVLYALLCSRNLKLFIYS